MDDLKFARKKLGKTWGKVKRATGIKKGHSSSEFAPHTDPDEARERYGDYRERLVDFYSRYNPAKLREVDSILKAYEGREEELFSRLEDLPDQDANMVSNEVPRDDLPDWAVEGGTGQDQGVRPPSVDPFTDESRNSSVTTNPFDFDEVAEDNDVLGSSNHAGVEDFTPSQPVVASPPAFDFNDPQPTTAAAVAAHLDDIFSSTSTDSPFSDPFGPVGAGDPFGGDILSQMKAALPVASPDPIPASLPPPTNAPGVRDPSNPFGEFDIEVIASKPATKSGLIVGAEREEAPTPASTAKVEKNTAAPAPPPPPPPGSPPQASIDSLAHLTATLGDGEAYFDDDESDDSFDEDEGEEEEEDFPGDEQEVVPSAKKKKKKKKLLSSIASVAKKGAKGAAKYAAKAATISGTTSSSTNPSKPPPPASSLGTMKRLLNGLSIQGAPPNPHTALITLVSNHTILSDSLFTFQWLKEPSPSGPFQPIPNACKPFYQPNASDLSRRISCLVTSVAYPEVSKTLTTPPLSVPNQTIKRRTVTALDTNSLLVPNLSAKTSIHPQSMALSSTLPELPDTLPVTDLTVAMDDSSLKLYHAASDTPRGILIEMKDAANVKIDPNDHYRLDISVRFFQQEVVSWFGDHGGELWQFWMTISDARKEGSGDGSPPFNQSDHFVIHFDFANSTFESRDVMFLATRTKSSDKFWLLPWDTDDNNSNNEQDQNGVGATPARDEDVVSQLIDLKRELEEERNKAAKFKRKYVQMKRQLDNTEEQLEQVSEAFDEVMQNKESEDRNSTSRIEELEEQIQQVEQEKERLKAEGDTLRDDLKAAKAKVEQMPDQLYKPKAAHASAAIISSAKSVRNGTKVDDEGISSGSIKGEQTKDVDVAKWKAEAKQWKMKADGMSKDMKRLLKSTVNAKELNDVKVRLKFVDEENIAYRKALEHALAQVEEMRLREMQILGQTFEHAPRPKSKSYVKVAKNIVHMRKRTASKAKKVARKTGKVVKEVSKTVVKSVAEGIKTTSGRTSNFRQRQKSKEEGFFEDEDEDDDDDDENLEEGEDAEEEISATRDAGNGKDRIAKELDDSLNSSMDEPSLMMV